MYSYELEKVIENNNLDELVRKLLAGDDADVNQTDLSGYTPLHIAVKWERIDDIKLLIEKGADVNQTDIQGKTPLHIAAINGYIEVVEYLIKHAASVNPTDLCGYTPLDCAAGSGRIDIAEFLIDSGANVNPESENCDTPLHMAAHATSAKESLEMTKFLIDKGANVNRADFSGKTPLHIAPINGYIEVVEYLIDNDADVNQVAANGKTPLYFAVKWRRIDVIKLLIEKGADVNDKISSYISRTNDNDETLLQAALKKGYVEVVKFLIKNGADVNLADRDGNTPLRIAAENGYVEIVALLIEICFEQENEIVTALECVFQQPEPELGAIYGCLMNYLCEGDFNKVLGFLADLELSKGIDDTTKKTFCNLLVSEIFLRCDLETLSPDTFTDFLLKLTESKTIERAPDAFLRAYLDNLLGFLFNFDKESQQFERIFYSIPMLKLALHLKNPVYINKSLQIILVRTEQNFDNRNALPQIENCESIVFECDQTLELCSSMRSLWDPQGLCYEKIIQWACDVYEIPENEALAACLTAFKALNENDHNLAAIQTALNEMPDSKKVNNPALIHFLKVFRILFNQHQTWYYDNWHELAEKIREIINDTEFFDSNTGVFKQTADEIKRLADCIVTSGIDLDNTNPDEIRILLQGLSELSADILAEIEVNQSSETHKRTSGLFDHKPSKLQVERVREFLTLLSDPLITPSVLLGQLNEFHGIDNCLSFQESVARIP
jgi:ankyrin repeat protein